MSRQPGLDPHTGGEGAVECASIGESQTEGLASPIFVGEVAGLDQQLDESAAGFGGRFDLGLDLGVVDLMHPERRHGESVAGPARLDLPSQDAIHGELLLEN